MTDNAWEMEKYYHTTIKLLLGVGISTPNITCKLEAGMPSLVDFIKHRRVSFISKFMSNMSDEALAQILKLCEAVDTPDYKFIKRARDYVDSAVKDGTENLKRQCEEMICNSSKMFTYVSINPTLECHSIYGQKCYVSDHYRHAFSRFRLSSHNLKIETGRWSRTPRESRVCSCGSVQDESHVLFTCNKT